MKKATLMLLFCGAYIFGTAQTTSSDNAAKKAPLEAKFLGLRVAPSDPKLWKTSLNNVSGSENESENEELLEQIKEKKNNLKFANASNAPEQKSTAVTPLVSTNFGGLDNSGNNTPLDNTIAISNGGIIVVCINSMIAYADVNGNVISGGGPFELYSLINDNTLPNNICDPKVIYDPDADRFIFYAQTCDGVSATDKIILGFSKSNTPSAGWWVYEFTGNPLNDNSWWDYPKMAVSSDELFVTGNLFYEGSGYNQSVVYQIQKAPCYAGTNTQSQYWYNINGNPFTILPVGTGIGSDYGPAGIYLVSTAGATNGSTNINLYHINNNIASGTATMSYNTITTTNYSTAGDAAQPSPGKNLNTGDCRALDGFYQNGIIHFVFNSDIGSGYCGINYNRLNVSSNTNTSSTFGLSGSYDYCYPAVAPIGTTGNDQSVIIAFNRSGSSLNPETRVVAVDGAGTWSNSVQVKAGATYIYYNWYSGATERWGDYTGICRKRNEQACWMSGMYANVSQYWGQWIAKIGGQYNGVQNVNADATNAKVYPNPVVDNYNVEFDLAEKGQIFINITDMQGKVVKELYKGGAQQGKNIFSFDKANLPNGTYLLNIYNNSNTIKNERIVITGK
jgi:hypothetical protein